MKILQRLRHKLNVLHSDLREARKRARRSPKWAALEKKFLRENGFCALCGGVDHLQVHHVKPFHLHPELELDPKNLLTTCMGLTECHLRIAHGGGFVYYNPQLHAHIALLKSGTPREQIEAEARKVRRR